MAHRERALDHDLAHIQKLITSMAEKVQYMLEASVRSLAERNTKLAEDIIQFDKEVDRIELQVDQAIYEIIALRQPAAGDLRLILAAIKINNDLERVGDYCEGICRQVILLNRSEPSARAEDLVSLSLKVSHMLGQCIKAFTLSDVLLAKSVILADDEVDDLTHLLFDDLHKEMQTSPEQIRTASALLLVAAKLERIADQATNISEEVVFSVTGDNIRHRSSVRSVPSR